jgi:hypothetical protein
MEEPQNVPDWLTIGITCLLPNLGDNNEGRMYQPITCRYTMYKILTGIITKSFSKELTEQNLLPAEQK